MSRWLLPPGALYLVLLVDWRGATPPGAPAVRRAFGVSAPLRAGAARVRLAAPLPVVRGGYGMPRAVAESEHDPLEVRAVVLRADDRGLALVLVDLVLVTDELAHRLEARLAELDLDGLVLAATHTHSSVGGFDSRLLAQVVGTGRYRADVVACLVDGAEQAVRQAAFRLAPVRVLTAQGRLNGWAENRSTPGGVVDDALTVAALDGERERVATLAVVSAHPTLFPRTRPQLSADYPGVAMRRLEADGGVALLFQGAEGDAQPPGSGEQAIQAAGAFVAQRVSEARGRAEQAGDRLAFAEAEVALPPAEPQAIRPFLLRRPAANVLELLAPATARVTAVTMGDLTLLGVPGEPTVLAAGRLVASLPKGAEAADRKLRVVGLVQGYVGYVETPERIREGSGESARVYFAPELVDVLGRGLGSAVAATLIPER